MKTFYPKTSQPTRTLEQDFIQTLVDQIPVFDQLIMKDIRPTDSWLLEVSAGAAPLFTWMSKETSDCLAHFNDGWNGSFHDHRFAPWPHGQPYETDADRFKTVFPNMTEARLLHGNEKSVMGELMDPTAKTFE